MKPTIGHLRKMNTALAMPVQYELVLSEHRIALNPLLKEKIAFRFTGAIYCIQCQRKIYKSFQQGYCYPCLQRLNECGNCHLFPERCQVESQTCPRDDWAHAVCYAKQVVYLANASGLKVGITRESYLLKRWIDQGAVQAVPLLRARNRYRAGLAEVTLKAFVSDRTRWRVMLRNAVEPLDMLKAAKDLLKVANTSVQDLVNTSADGLSLIEERQPISIQYPVLQYPEKIKSLSFDQQPLIEGVLLGIKGQYLILDQGVFNVRKFGGYEVEFCVQSSLC